MSGITEFFRALWHEIVIVWALLMDFLLSIFEPQSGWQPKVIFGAILLVLIYMIAKRGTKS